MDDGRRRLEGLAGRLAFVSGAAGGIGAAVVRALCAAGARVVAADIAGTGLAALAVERGDDVRPITLDVTDAAAVDTAVTRIEDEVGPIDFGVAAAGVLATGALVETTAEVLRRMFEVNAVGTFNLLAALGRPMKSRRRGALVAVSSNAAYVPRHGMGAYAASKAAASMLTRCLCLELAPFGVRCNIVAPGSTLTPMLTGMWRDKSDAEQVIVGNPSTFRAGIPLGKIASPEDVAEGVLFLLSDRAAHVTMASLTVDGGATLHQ